MIFRSASVPEDMEVSFNYKEPYCSIKLQGAFNKFLNHFDPEENRHIIILCIGTDRSTGDALGPLTGSRLVDLGLPANCVYGTLDNPVHATNLKDILTLIEAEFHNPLLIPIDACLGKMDRVGNLNVRYGTLSPGTAVKKDLPSIGEFHISGNVNVSGFLEHMVLQNTRLSVVVNMADVISRAVFFALCRRSNPNLKTPTPLFDYPSIPLSQLNSNI